MLTVFHIFTICFVAAVLFVAVDWFETNRWYAVAFKFLIIALGAAAVVRRFLP